MLENTSVGQQQSANIDTLHNHTISNAAQSHVKLLSRVKFKGNGTNLGNMTNVNDSNIQMLDLT